MDGRRFSRSESLILSFSDLKLFSKCPRLYRRRNELIVPPPSQLFSVCTRIIKQAYIRATETGHLASWKQIIGWVDERIFKNVDISNQEAYEAAQKIAEHILFALQKWYEQHYLVDKDESYIDLRLDIEMDRHLFRDSIDIIQLANPIKILSFTQNDISYMKAYNDIVTRGKVWAVAHNLGCDEVLVKVCRISKQKGEFAVLDVLLHQREHQRIKQVSLELAKGIQSGLSYPVRSLECERCPLRTKCRL